MNPNSPHDLSTRFERSDLTGQFTLSAQALPVPKGWETVLHDGWTLGRDPRLPLTRVRASPACTVWLLGHPIDTRLSLLLRNEAEALQSIASQPAGIEAWVTGLSGCFAALLFSEEAPARLYLDPAGLLSVVYDADRRLAGSTVTAFPYEGPHEDESELIELFDVAHSNRYFPFGLTARKGFRRLLPNHFLDLAAMQPVRHWPRRPLRPTHPEEAVPFAVGVLQANMRACGCLGQPYMSLTAGRDSRMLVACARSHAHELELFTWALDDETGQTDLALAQAMAARHGLPHRGVAPRPLDPRDRDLWLYRTGCCIGEVRGLSLASTHKTMDRTRPFFLGVCSEVGRGILWRAGDKADQPIPSQQLMERLGLPYSKVLHAAAQSWLDALPMQGRFEVLDLLYIEQRMGCWAGPIRYGDVADGPIRFGPFNSRPLFEAMMGLPYDYRARQAWTDDVIRATWPDLLEFPFNPTTWKTGLILRARSVFRRVPGALRLRSFLKRQRVPGLG